MQTFEGLVCLCLFLSLSLSFLTLHPHLILSPQTLPAGIISTGATWSPNMECATTSFTASSAARPVPIQTYNSLRRLSLIKEHEYLDWQKDFCGHPRLRGSSFVLFLRACGKKLNSQRHLNGRVGELPCSFLFPRDAGHLDTRPLWLTVPWRNVIRTVQLKEMITRRN